jgi:transposase InsO family protein
MSDLCRLIWCALIGLFRSRAALEAEILVLRHQLNVLQRKCPKRAALSSIDRLVLVGLYSLVPGVMDALKIIRPETLLRWHRAGFRAYWRWKSRPRGGRPKTAADIRRLIREMSVANPLWGAPRIHGELLKLGIDVGQTTVAKYMAKRRQPPSQGWKTFLHNHADGIASMDLFLVPTLSFQLLYGFLILRHGRRELLWLGVTAHPSAEWIARQLTEAYGWRQAPRYIIRDRDRVYGHAVLRRLRAMGIRDRPTAPRSPWQNGCAERLIGSIRRDCLDHVAVFGERHLRHLLKSYQKYYNDARTHLSLKKDTPIPRAVQTVGQTLAVPILGGYTINISECEFPTGTAV